MKNIIYKKRIISILLILSLVLNNVCILYAKKASFEEGEVESPTGVENDFTSEGIIIHEEKSDEITPLHATPSYMMSEEYKNVDNFIIDIKTIPDRIKYFSPTYINYKNTAVNKIRSSFYSAGGSEYNYYFVKNTINDLPDQKRLANSTLKELNNNLKKLESLGIHSGPQYEALVAGITEVNIAIATIDATSSSLSQAALGFGSAVRMINNIDSNNSMQYLNNTLSKSLINAFLSYKQLEFYESLLNKQVKLYENMVNVYIGNYAHGISTSDELRKQILNLENAKKTRSSIKSTKNNVKEMIAINLGYEKKDFDRLIFVDPEIDYTYLYEVSPSSHYEQAYNSNTVYNNIRTSGRSDKKLPGSTGDAIKEESLNQAKNKIINKLDYLFDIMKTSFYLYSELKYLSEIIKLNEEANKRKYDTNLVSDVEYEGLRVQNEANIMSLKTMKYDLIKNAINYKYAILGIMDIE